MTQTGKSRAIPSGHHFRDVTDCGPRYRNDTSQDRLIDPAIDGLPELDGETLLIDRQNVWDEVHRFFGDGPVFEPRVVIPVTVFLWFPAQRGAPANPANRLRRWSRRLC